MLDTYIDHRGKAQKATYCFYFLMIFLIQNLNMRTGVGEDNRCMINEDNIKSNVIT
jgi:hypothetical protein